MNPIKLYSIIAAIVAITGAGVSAAAYFYHQGATAEQAKQAEQAITAYADAMEQAQRERDDWIQVSNSLSKKYIAAELEYSNAKKRLATFDFSDTDTVNAGIASLLAATEEASRRIASASAGSSAATAPGTGDAGAVSGRGR